MLFAVVSVCVLKKMYFYLIGGEKVYLNKKLFFHKKIKQAFFIT